MKEPKTQREQGSKRCPCCGIKGGKVFENLTYSQQASSQKTRINWNVIAVAAHEDKGSAEGKKGVAQYRQRVVSHLRTIIEKLERGERR